MDDERRKPESSEEMIRRAREQHRSVSPFAPADQVAESTGDAASPESALEPDPTDAANEPGDHAEAGQGQIESASSPRLTPPPTQEPPPSEPPPENPA